MTEHEKLSLGVVLTLLLRAGLYDLSALTFFGYRGTISYTLWMIDHRWKWFGLTVAFAAGLLIGHLFLPQWPDGGR